MEGLSSRVSFELWRRVIIIRYSIDEKRTTYISLVTSIPVNTFQLEFQLKLKTKILHRYVLLTYLVHVKFWHVDDLPTLHSRLA